jgi:hypothetical protein
MTGLSGSRKSGRKRKGVWALTEQNMYEGTSRTICAAKRAPQPDDKEAPGAADTGCSNQPGGATIMWLWPPNEHRRGVQAERGTLDGWKFHICRKADETHCGTAALPGNSPQSRQNNQEGCVLSTLCCADYNPCFKDGNKLGSSCCPIQTLCGRLQDASKTPARPSIHLLCNARTESNHPPEVHHHNL